MGTIRTREEVKKQISKTWKGCSEEIIDAYTTINMTYEERMAELRAKYPTLPDEALEQYYKDDDKIANCMLEDDEEYNLYFEDDKEHYL